MSIEIIFNLVQYKSCELRKKNKNADGKKFWQPIKKILEENDNIKSLKWKNINKKDQERIMLLPEYYIDGYGNQHIIELNHFIIQTVRIPLQEKVSLKKIIQIALNIGQYIGSGGKKEKWMSLDNYLTKKNINIINLKISKTLYENIKKVILI